MLLTGLTPTSNLPLNYKNTSFLVPNIKHRLRDPQRVPEVWTRVGRKTMPGMWPGRKEAALAPGAPASHLSLPGRGRGPASRLPSECRPSAPKTKRLNAPESLEPSRCHSPGPGRTPALHSSGLCRARPPHPACWEENQSRHTGRSSIRASPNTLESRAGRQARPAWEGVTWKAGLQATRDPSFHLLGPRRLSLGG